MITGAIIAYLMIRLILGRSFPHLLHSQDLLCLLEMEDLLVGVQEVSFLLAYTLCLSSEVEGPLV